MANLGVGIGERIGDEEECDRRALENCMNNMRVAMPGRIVDFNAVKQTATVQPLLREYVRGEWLELPPLLDVPCSFPRAGGYCLTFPVKPDDECLIIFNDMCIDAWWQSGDVQNQLETRRHDLSDAMAILGITSVPRAVKNYSTNSVMLRNEAGDSFVEIVDGAKTVNITGAAAVNIKGVADVSVNSDANVNIGAQANVIINVQGDVNVTAQGGASVSAKGAMTLESDAAMSIAAPNINLSGNLSIEGNITHSGNMTTGGRHTDAIGSHFSG